MECDAGTLSDALMLSAALRDTEQAAQGAAERYPAHIRDPARVSAFIVMGYVLNGQHRGVRPDRISVYRSFRSL